MHIEPSIIKRLILLFLAFAISGCASPNHSKKLLDSINIELLKDYKINNGYLLATYDLGKVYNGNSIYSKDFVKIINDDSYNDNFLKKLESKVPNLKIIESQASIKIQQIKKFVLTLSNKYKFLPKSELAMFCNKQQKERMFNKTIRDAIKVDSMSELSKLDKLLATMPILLPEYQPVITSHYGKRKDPHHKKVKLHCGIDLADNKSSAIYSSADGKVLAIKREKSYGNIIEISHNTIFKTKYAHLKKIYVKEGDIVLRGQKIGMQGSTGKTTGEHLHFEILLNGKHVNPFDFISHGFR